MRKITCKESYVHYLGKNIQNEIIELLGSLIRDQILSEMQKSKYYSVILDCTPDVSRTEQMTLVLRYVLCDEGKYPEVKERFLCFIPIESSTGEALTDVLLSKLNEMNLPIGNMRGQGYDNGLNMRGKNAGVQKRILDINPRAFFVPCSAHTLNLVVNDSALSCTDAVNFFMVLQEMYNYLSASTHRWTVLKKHVSALTVKPLSDTRWESRIDAIGPVRYQAGEIYDTLLELSTDPSGDAYAKSTALGGETADLGQFPWMALLGYQQNQLNFIEYLCGGTLITETFVLTAAHCLGVGPNHQLVQVRFGELNLNTELDCKRVHSTYICSDEPVDVPVLTYFIHGQYDTLTLKNDIALVKLAKSVTFTGREYDNKPNPSQKTIHGKGFTKFSNLPGYPTGILMQTDMFICRLIWTVCKQTIICHTGKDPERSLEVLSRIKPALL
ncbi:unnamed protein product [Diabrotica balteata]|uniref:Peptidase S1 domain-containing protein n=1 Tax=Diabrotica balteata TaxID=107213 RepID=A0A9N9T7U5_DIABA|nr:unnamed protein product [Diabrotica balteata]